MTIRFALVFCMGSGLAAAFAAKPASEWSFEEQVAPTTGSTKTVLVAGVKGRALSVRPDAPMRFHASSSCAAEGALSFHYRLPVRPADPPRARAREVALLSFGKQDLLYSRGKLLWVPSGSGPDARKAWTPTHSYLSSKRFSLIEVGWSAEEDCYIFHDGLVVTKMAAFDPEETDSETVDLTLHDGVFDEVRLEGEALVSGTRYKGILQLERFDGPELPRRWVWYNRNTWKEGMRRVPGYNGSPGAMATPLRDGRYRSMYLPLGFFRVTEDTYLCGAFYLSNGGGAFCMVRIRPELEIHPNHWLRFGMPKSAWRPLKIPMARFRLQSGYLAQGVSFGSRGTGERYVAADNVCLFRGKDSVPPARVTGLQAREEGDGVRLTWNPASDDICVREYRVFWSNLPTFRLDSHEIVGSTLDTHFTHTYITHPGTWYYTVAAVDLFDNQGDTAEPAEVTLEK